jgi:3-deoxy-manno-octulosonate cytidylyltransferase (CMP-KDO synthetase)
MRREEYLRQPVGFKVAIPARYASQRLPGKPLLEIAGKPMLQHVFERAVQSGAEDVVIATDDERIVRRARDFGARVCMTSSSHLSGSERLAETAHKLAWPDDTVVVNLQGDEPLMPPANIRQVAVGLATQPKASIATLCVPISCVTEYENPNVVKVVRDHDGFALYFSRASIPALRDNSQFTPYLGHYYRHIGLYAYRASYLKSFAGMPPCELEHIESLEQLRALWWGERIHVAEAAEPPGRGVDTPDDLTAVCKLYRVRRLNEIYG